MIATPGDVQAERKIVRVVIHEWNAAHSKTSRLVLLPVGWDTHSAPAMGDRPQEILNKQILQDCDLLVAAFWTRLGTDTGKAPSGTVEEIQEHIAAGKPAMLYFSNTPVTPDSVDQAQYASLVKFKQKCMSDGLIEEYNSHEQFKEKFARQLQITVQSKLQQLIPTPELLEEQLAARTGLSDDAQDLLITAADQEGEIHQIRSLRGARLQVGEKNMNKDLSHREFARWEATLQKLIEAGLIIDRGLRAKGQLFELTHSGYQLVDQLKA